jgi:hypothetical protein
MRIHVRVPENTRSLRDLYLMNFWGLAIAMPIHIRYISIM